MPLWDVNESVEKITDDMLLGYFESIRGIFITKWVFLAHFVDNSGESLVPANIDQAVLNQVNAQFPDPVVYPRFQAANKHLVANYLGDVISNAIIGPWIVLEQLIKYLPRPPRACLSHSRHSPPACTRFGFVFLSR